MARRRGNRMSACYGIVVSSASSNSGSSPEGGRFSSQTAAGPMSQNPRASQRAPYVVAIVLNWNNLPDTLECLTSLEGSDYTNFAVWVVDNDSREDPSTIIHERHPGVRVLRNARNLGYGAGNNAALTRAIDDGAVYVLLLNNDVVVAPDTIGRLVRVAEADHRIAMATPRVFYYDRPTEIYWDGGIIDWETGETPHDSRGLPVEGHLRKSEWLDGCALLVRVSAIEDVGLLDERYFLYFEDVEWSVRALRRGWTNAVALQAHAWHKVSRSTGGLKSPAVRYYYARNRYLFMNAYCPAGYLWKLRYASRLFREYRLVRHEREGRRVIVAACVSLVLSRWGPYEATADFRRFVRVLDALLLLALRGVSVVTAFLLPIRKVIDLFAAGKNGGRGS